MLTNKRLLFSQTTFGEKKIYREQASNQPKSNNGDKDKKRVKDDRGHKDNKDIDIEMKRTLLLILAPFEQQKSLTGQH